MTPQSRHTCVPVDPFVFVCATRYAVLRTLTGASEMVAQQVRAHAEEIKREPGAVSAIRQEFESARSTILEPAGLGQTAYERTTIISAWERAMEALDA